MSVFFSHLRPIVGGLLPLAVLAGCASSSKELAAKAQLEKARVAYRQAQDDPNVRAYAQLGLVDAQKAVQAAEAAKRTEDVQHLGYVAEKRAQIASIAAATRKTENDMQQLNKEAADVLLEGRDRELKATRAEVEAKAREAEQARMAVEARARDAEAKAREAEQARVRAETEAKAYAAEQAKTAALTKELSALKAQPTDRGLVLTVGDVLFDAGRAEVAPGGQRSIDKLAEFLKNYPKRNVLIEGHTDSTGNEDFNVKLSAQRANAVRDLLVARGVAVERIATRGYRPKYPIVQNDTPAGRQQNRRVEILVLNEGASLESASR